MVGSVLENGEVLVDGGQILAVGTGISKSHPNESICDLKNCALLPGFVNTHSHLEPTLRRNFYDGLNLWDWLDKLGFRKDCTPDPEALQKSAALGAAECALSGITCLGEASFSGASFSAIKSVGLRAVVYLEVFGQSAGERYDEVFNKKLDMLRDLQAEAPDRIILGISPHSIYTSNAELLKLCANTCSNLHIPISIHLAETEAESEYSIKGSGQLADFRRRIGYEPMVSGLSPTMYLQELDLLQKGVCLAHCVSISEDEIALIAKSGASVAHCPRSNAYLGAGVAPILQMSASGIPIGLGTDSAVSCIKFDFFEEMRFSMGIHRALAKDAGVLTAKDVLMMATIGGAKALGLDDKIGTLEIGKRADMIAVDMGEMQHEEDIWLAIISRSPADVVLSLVDGKGIKKFEIS